MSRSSISQWRSCRADDSDSDSSESSARSSGRAERWPCSQCDRDYATKSNLLRHFNATHTTQRTTVVRREERYPCLQPMRQRLCVPGEPQPPSIDRPRKKRRYQRQQPSHCQLDTDNTKEQAEN